MQLRRGLIKNDRGELDVDALALDGEPTAKCLGGDWAALTLSLRARDRDEKDLRCAAEPREDGLDCAGIVPEI